MRPNTLILLGHPDRNSFCAALADVCMSRATAAGHEVRVLRLGELSFDPVLHHGCGQLQPLEPDLLRAQSDILWRNVAVGCGK